MAKTRVRVGGYKRQTENVKSHVRRATKVKPYIQMRQSSKKESKWGVVEE